MTTYNDFVETVCGPQIWFCLFMFRPVMLQQFFSLTTIYMFSCLGGPEVAHPTAVLEVPGSIHVSDKDFYVCFFVMLVCFYFLDQKPSLVM